MGARINRTVSAETREKLRQAALGKKHSPEARQRISETRKRKINDGTIRADNAKKRVVPEIVITPEYGHWLAGFVDGDGCFSATNRDGGVTASFSIGLRRDDDAVLHELKEAFGFGTVYYSRNNIGVETVAYSVQARADLVAIGRLFELYPLRTKKREDWWLWKQIVEHCFETYNPRHDDVQHLIAQMKAIKHL